MIIGNKEYDAVYIADKDNNIIATIDDSRPGTFDNGYSIVYGYSSQKTFDELFKEIDKIRREQKYHRDKKGAA